MSSVYDRFNSYAGRDGALIHHYFDPASGEEFWYRIESGEWLVFAQTHDPYIDEWKTIEIEEWESEMGGEVAWDDLLVYANGNLNMKEQA